MIQTYPPSSEPRDDDHGSIDMGVRVSVDHINEQ